jgi:hypothetical protein
MSTDPCETSFHLRILCSCADTQNGSPVSQKQFSIQSVRENSNFSFPASTFRQIKFFLCSISRYITIYRELFRQNLTKFTRNLVEIHVCYSLVYFSPSISVKSAH